MKCVYSDFTGWWECTKVGLSGLLMAWVIVLIIVFLGPPALKAANWAYVKCGGK